MEGKFKIVTSNALPHTRTTLSKHFHRVFFEMSNRRNLAVSKSAYSIHDQLQFLEKKILTVS